MKSELGLTKDIEEKVISFLKSCGAIKILVFGSYVRGEATPESDLDIIVEFGKNISLLDLVGFEMELSEQLGIKVELLTEKSISPYIIEDVLAEAKVIYS
ncbi:MAG: nucleotidyltransferase family protein [Candidatus Hodarchaeota archaeon]